MEGNPKDCNSTALVRKGRSMQCNQYMWGNIKRISTSFLNYVGTHSCPSQVDVDQIGNG